ncbi:uncharacterized protein irgq1 [Siphateles boraxobius]|uniref:uncharacterized protein irgq1 n=1 Tax=Siphateles boraxobius TaxID=180520 RepID=UPI0040635C6E
MDRFYMPEKIQEDHLNKIKDVFASESPEKIPHQLISLLEVFDHFKIDIAVTGESGAGKSSLINVFLGLNPDDTRAAPTGAVETTKQPTMYPHSNLPHVRLWDLPGMGTPSFTSKSYVKTMNFDLYDMFMVVISERVRENNMLLIDEIGQQKKPFYFIRTKVDNDMLSQRKKSKFSEKSALDQMRRDCEKYLKEKKLDPHVFLVSAHETQNYEMQNLMDTLKNEVSQLRAEVFSSFLDKMFHGGWINARHATHHIQETGKLQADDITTLQNMYKSTGFGAAKVSVVLEALSDFKLDVAVLGETGSGASTLVNALIGLENEVSDAAYISSPAISPGYPNVQFWDVSGIEANMDYSMNWTKQAIDCYDFYIIILSDCQKARHIKLAKAVEQLRKHYLFVQTKTDCHLQTRTDLYCDETEILDGLRAQYTQELQMAKLYEQQIFLINSLNRSAFDFIGLESALSSDLNTVRASAFAYYIARIVKQHK